MKVEIINDENMEIFLNKYNFINIDINDKDSLLTEIKNILIKINNRYNLNLCGFYKIKVYPNKNIGVFLNIIKIDDNEFNNEADFRIVIYPNEKFFFETEYFDVLPESSLIRYYQNKFYIDINDFNNIDKYMDMGKIIYDEDAKKMLSLSIILK